MSKINENMESQGKYFKACLDVVNFKKQVDERIMHIVAKNIIQAMDITKKIKGSQLKYLIPETKKEYDAGVSLKYDKKKPAK